MRLKKMFMNPHPLLDKLNRNLSVWRMYVPETAEEFPTLGDYPKVYIFTRKELEEFWNQIKSEANTDDYYAKTFDDFMKEQGD